MTLVIIFVLVFTLFVSILNFILTVRVARELTYAQATSADKAIDLEKDPWLKLTLMGPIPPWANIKRTSDRKYWYVPGMWKFARYVVIVSFAAILFVNIFLLLYFVSVL